MILDHAEKFHELPDEYMSDILPAAKKIALALGLTDYNLLQVRMHFQLADTTIHSTPRLFDISLEL